MWRRNPRAKGSFFLGKIRVTSEPPLFSDGIDFLYLPFRPGVSRRSGAPKKSYKAQAQPCKVQAKAFQSLCLRQLPIHTRSCPVQEQDGPRSSGGVIQSFLSRCVSAKRWEGVTLTPNDRPLAGRPEQRALAMGPKRPEGARSTEAPLFWEVFGPAKTQGLAANMPLFRTGARSCR